jgi:biotin carboxyl carrier protein
MASGIEVESGGEKEQGQQQTQQQPGAISRSRLVARLLGAGNNLQQFVADLITQQALMVAGTEAAAFAIEPSADPQSPFNLRAIAHIRPDDSPNEVKQAALREFQKIIGPHVHQNRNAVIAIENPAEMTEPQFCLVTMLRSEGNPVIASAVITRCRDTDLAQQRLAAMELVAGYFEIFTARRKLEQAQIIAANHQHVLQYNQSVASAEGFESAAMNLANEMATRTGAARVSVGWLKGEKIKLKAMSHTEQFDRKQELSVLIEKVMEECLDQEEIVQFDPEGKETSQNVTRDAQQLSRVNGNEMVISLPLRAHGEIHGVVTLEYPSNKKLAQQDATALAVGVELLGPQLYDRYQNDRFLITKAGLSTKWLAEQAIGPKYMLAKLITAVVIAFVLFAVFFKQEYKVSAPFQFGVIEKRTACAPFEGVIEKAFVKPGDEVKAGTPLFKMRTIDLEHKREASRRQMLSKQALAEASIQDPRKQAEAQALLAEARAAEAEMRLYQDQIEQATVKAPMDGVVLLGDLTDKQGAPVKLGDPLMDIGRRDDLRAELLVAERDIQDIVEGQMGVIATNSDPTQARKIRVDTKIPQGIGKEGENNFKIYAELLEKDPRWSPGQLGEAKVEMGKRRFAWIYTLRLIDFIRIKVWKWF